MVPDAPGPAAAATKRAAREKLDEQDRLKYRKRMLELRLEGVKYSRAAIDIEIQFREKKHDRHHTTRIRELAPNPITKENPTPPKDYIR